jgi:hypothetical protein
MGPQANQKQTYFITKITDVNSRKNGVPDWGFSSSQQQRYI